MPPNFNASQPLFYLIFVLRTCFKSPRKVDFACAKRTQNQLFKQVLKAVIFSFSFQVFPAIATDLPEVSRPELSKSANSTSFGTAPRFRQAHQSINLKESEEYSPKSPLTLAPQVPDLESSLVLNAEPKQLGSDLPRDRPPEEPLPETPLPQLPAPEELLPPTTQPPTTPSESIPGEVPETIQVERYEVVGSTVFTPEEFAEVTQPFTGNASFSELLQARSAVTQLYTQNGYITSGAFIPPQTLENGVVQIQVVEGQLEGINVTGTRRLNSSYIADRLAIAAAAPLNVNRLLQGLQLLQLDPLIQNLSAELAAGVRPGTSLLNVAVVEADSFSLQIDLNNGRSPSVGSFRRQVEMTQANLLGLGDGLVVGYTNTDGSNGVDASYTLPINPRNGTLRFAFGITGSEVIEDPFNALDIQAKSRYYELTYRQPLFQTPGEEFALGITASHQTSRTELGFADIGGFPLSPGADADGRTRVTALRFFQEWTQRSSRHVLAARSQFSLGIDALDATINENAPDSRFFAWRGQGQWVRLLAPDTLLLVRTDVQFSDGAMLPLEQFGIGGQNSVRGYRQDFILADNGALASAELRFPVLRVRDIDGLLQVVPFFDIGIGWNNSNNPDPDPDTLIGVGLGVQWRQGDRFTARLDWGIPLVSVDSREKTWQENGIYFSVVYSPF
jgi:hemolysin activation/secretion protein